MRLLKASDIQSPDDPARKLAEQREKAIRDALITMLSGLAGLFTGDAVLKMIMRLDSQGLTAILNSQESGDLLVSGYQPIADTFLAAARQAANDNLKGLIPYDPLAAAAALQSLRDELGDSVDAGANSVIRMLLLDSLRTGTDPTLVATRLRQVIGLDVQSAKAVANYRRLLQAGDSTVLQRALRDQRFDDVVRAAVRGNVRMTPELIDKLVASYADRMLTYRAERMAATEAMQAAVSGIRDAHVQAVKSGRLFDSEVRRSWKTAADERVCPVCSSVPVLNPDGIGVNDEYKSINGPVDAPLLHPWCRCSEVYIADLSRLTEQPFRLAA